MEADVARMLRFSIHIEAKVAHTLRTPWKFIEWTATAEGICSLGWCSYLTSSTEIQGKDRDGRGRSLRIPRFYRMDHDGRGHMRSGIVVIPYEFH